MLTQVKKKLEWLYIKTQSFSAKGISRAIRRSIHQKGIASWIFMYLQQSAQIFEGKWIEMQEEIDKSTLTVWHFNPRNSLHNW